MFISITSAPAFWRRSTPCVERELELILVDPADGVGCPGLPDHQVGLLIIDHLAHIAGKVPGGQPGTDQRHHLDVDTRQTGDRVRLRAAPDRPTSGRPAPRARRTRCRRRRSAMPSASRPRRRRAAADSRWTGDSPEPCRRPRAQRRRRRGVSQIVAASDCNATRLQVDLMLRLPRDPHSQAFAARQGGVRPPACTTQSAPPLRSWSGCRRR